MSGQPHFSTRPKLPPGVVLGGHQERRETDGKKQERRHQPVEGEEYVR
jgi:hypothetical protein